MAECETLHLNAGQKCHVLTDQFTPEHLPRPGRAAEGPLPPIKGPLPGPAVPRVVSFLEGVQVLPRAREGFADPAACNLTPGLETPLGPVPRSSVPRTGCNHLLAGQP